MSHAREVRRFLRRKAACFPINRFFAFGDFSGHGARLLSLRSWVGIPAVAAAFSEAGMIEGHVLRFRCLIMKPRWSKYSEPYTTKYN